MRRDLLLRVFAATAVCLWLGGAAAPAQEREEDDQPAAQAEQTQPGEAQPGARAGQQPPATEDRQPDATRDRVRDRIQDRREDRPDAGAARDRIQDRREDRPDAGAARDRIQDRREERRDQAQERGGPIRDRVRSAIERWRSGDENFGATFNIDGNQFRVRRVQQGSGAEQLGLRENDAILSIDGQPVQSEEQFHGRLFDEQGQGRMSVEIMRNGQRRELDFNPGAWFAARQDRGAGRGAELGFSLNVNDEKQLVVEDLRPQSPAFRAGLRPNDVIVSVNGQDIRTEAEFRRNLFAGNQRQTQVVVLRNGQEQVVALRPEIWQSAGGQFDRGPDSPRFSQFGAGGAWLGVTLDSRYGNHAVVEGVQEGSAAERAGLRAGDWIVSLNGQRVTSANHLTQIIGQMQAGEEVDIAVSRRHEENIRAELGERPQGGARFQFGEGGPSSGTLDRERGAFRDDRRVPEGASGAVTDPAARTGVTERFRPDTPATRVEGALEDRIGTTPEDRVRQFGPAATPGTAVEGPTQLPGVRDRDTTAPGAAAPRPGAAGAGATGTGADAGTTAPGTGTDTGAGATGTGAGATGTGAGTGGAGAGASGAGASGAGAGGAGAGAGGAGGSGS